MERVSKNLNSDSDIGGLIRINTTMSKSESLKVCKNISRPFQGHHLVVKDFQCIIEANLYTSEVISTLFQCYRNYPFEN